MAGSVTGSALRMELNGSAISLKRSRETNETIKPELSLLKVAALFIGGKHGFKRLFRNLKSIAANC